MNRKAFFIIRLLIILIGFSLSVNASAPIPKLTVSPESIDLGKIETGQVVEHQLTFQNSGNAVLIINAMSTDCPCTSFQVLKDGKYQPDLKILIHLDEQVEIKLTFDPSKTNYIGKFKKLIVISSNDPEMPLKRIEMVGEIVAQSVVLAN